MLSTTSCFHMLTNQTLDGCYCTRLVGGGKNEEMEMQSSNCCNVKVVSVQLYDLNSKLL